VLQDVGLVNKRDRSMVIDKNKVRRERVKIRKRLQDNIQKEISGLYFDGRKDKTRVQLKKGTKYYARTISEEHITLVCEPGSQYLGHVTPSGGDAKNIQKSIVKFLSKNDIDTRQLVAIGCDGTNVNTGASGGVIHLLESELGRPLQWLICMLHANELPLRHLIQKLDGVTHGPKGFSGVIGRALTTCEELPIVKFLPINFEDCPVLDAIDISTDQKYLYNMYKAVSSGQCLIDLALQKPGPVVHSRWLTTANRILRLYVSTDNPTENLVTLANYIVKVYAPVWFHIKSKSACSQGSRHLY